MKRNMISWVKFQEMAGRPVLNLFVFGGGGGNKNDGGSPSGETCNSQDAKKREQRRSQAHYSRTGSFKNKVSIFIFYFSLPKKSPTPND